jgi:hypothetical protein
MANILHKIEVKVDCLNEVGSKLDDFKESCEKELTMLKGAIRESDVFKTKIAMLHGHVDKDLDKGVINGITQPLQIASYVKRYISRAVETVGACCDTLKTQEIQEAAKVKAHERSIEYTKKLLDQELKKIQNIKESIGKGHTVLDSLGEIKSNLKDEHGNVIPLKGRKRPTGVHPGRSLKSRRLQKQANNEFNKMSDKELEAELLKE